MKTRIPTFSTLYSHFILAVKGTEQDYTSGSIRKAIFMLSVPVVIEMIGEALFALIDMIFVSHISNSAAATVGFTEQMMFVVYSIAIGLSMATTAIVSRRTGEKNLKGAAEATTQAIIVAVVAGGILGILGVVFARQLLNALGAEPEVLAEGLGFTQIIFAGNVVIMLLFIINGAFRGAGNAALAMRALLIANGINLVLDPLFIFGIGNIPGLGVKGAAIATTTGRGLGVVFQLYILFGGKSALKLAWEKMKVNTTIILDLLKVSVGGIGQFLIETASWIFLLRIIAESGTEAVAGYQIGFRIIAFTLLPSWGIAQAAAALVGQNLGAGKPDRAEKSTWKSSWYNMLFLILVSIVFYVAAEPIITYGFTKDPVVVEHAKNMLQILCLGYVFFGFGMVMVSAFNGAGDTKTPTIINVLVLWIIQIPMAYVLAKTLNMGVMGVLITISVCHSIHAVISVLVFRMGKWKKQQV